MAMLFSEMSNLLSNGQSFVLATVVTRNGSAPRSAGARMIVRRDGTTAGTVGGGILEANVEKLAAQVMQTHLAELQGFKFSGKDAATMDAICGGEVEVLVEWLDADYGLKVSIVQALAQAVQQRKKIWTVTVLTGDEMGLAALVQGDGQVVGKLPAGLPIGEEGSPPTEMGITMAGPQRVMIELLDSGKVVYIFGAGHVSRALAEFTKAVGFKTVVLDDRADYACVERFPSADETIVLESFTDAVAKVEIDRNSFIVIVTRGHLHDQTVLGQALKTSAGYIGMIGSRRKCGLTFDELRKEGFSEADIKRVHAPIGLAIDAETPEEIGVSIVAEMIQERAKNNHE